MKKKIKFVSVLAVIILLAMPASVSAYGAHYIFGVPSRTGFAPHSCGVTAATNVLAYYQAQFSYNGLNYAQLIGPGESESSLYDQLADAMGYKGEALSSWQVRAGIEAVANDAVYENGYSFEVDLDNIIMTWNEFKSEIDNDRPVIIGVSDHPDYADHFMVAVGYLETDRRYVILHDGINAAEVYLEYGAFLSSMIFTRPGGGEVGGAWFKYYGAGGDSVQFTEAGFDATGQVAYRAFSLGDGSTKYVAPGESFYHTYEAPGTYQVTLRYKATRTGDSVYYRIRTVTATDDAPPCVAWFSYIDWKSGGQVLFKDRSLDIDGSTLSIAYSWGDGRVSYIAAGESIEHCYSDPGVYLVTLRYKTSDTGGSNCVCTRLVEVSSGSN